MPIRLFFLVRSLEYGGAERQLVELVRGLDKQQFSVTVAAFYDGGALRKDIEELDGVRLVSLGKKDRWDVVRFVWCLLRAVRAARPDVVHGYMGVANELSVLVGKVVRAKVVWGLRTSNMDLARYGDWLPVWSFRIAAKLSRYADLIIVNSEAGRRHHVANGYCGRRMVVVPNGIDTLRYRPDRELGLATRMRWGVAANEVLIGLVGRLDPVKDHPTFLQAAAALSDCPNVRFVCVGDGPEPYKRELHELANRLGLSQRLIWAGAWNDMTAAYNALDMLTLSSAFGEGFPNAVGEAMACGVPCVATDVGDAVAIIGDTGKVVPRKEPELLAAAWRAVACLSATERLALGMRARERVSARFSGVALIERTEALLRELTST